MLSINEINQLQTHNIDLQNQNRDLQKERILLTKALELAIADYKIEDCKIELTSDQMKEEIEDYRQQAAIILNTTKD